MIDLTEEQLERYSRHILLKDVGVEGQEKILSSKVMIIGAGGLGSPVALYLAAAGVGTLGIVDGDKVDLSNLQRQIIHFTTDIATPKVHSAAAKIAALNPEVKIHAIRENVFASNIREIIRGYGFVVDGTDNFAAKFLINDACVMEKIPYSHGGILRFTGQTMTILPGQSACYRCVFSAPRQRMRSLPVRRPASWAQSPECWGQSRPRKRSNSLPVSGRSLPINC